MSVALEARIKQLCHCWRAAVVVAETGLAHLAGPAECAGPGWGVALVAPPGCHCTSLQALNSQQPSVNTWALLEYIWEKNFITTTTKTF